MHGATWVQSCLPPFFMDERMNDLYLSAILWDIKSLYYTGIYQGFLSPQPRNNKMFCHDKTCCRHWPKSAPIHTGVSSAKNIKKNRKKHVDMATLCQPKNLIRSNPCKGMTCKEHIKIFVSPTNQTKCCHCCQVL